jgi:hypothetical protein
MFNHELQPFHDCFLQTGSLFRRCAAVPPSSTSRVARSLFYTGPSTEPIRKWAADLQSPCTAMPVSALYNACLKSDKCTRHRTSLPGRTGLPSLDRDGFRGHGALPCGQWPARERWPELERGHYPGRQLPNGWGRLALVSGRAVCLWRVPRASRRYGNADS